MAGDKHVLTFFWFQRFVAFICMLEQIISSNGKYSIVSILFLLDMKYVGMLSVALCLDRGLIHELLTLEPHHVSRNVTLPT